MGRILAIFRQIPGEHLEGERRGVGPWLKAFASANAAPLLHAG
jgi:hypothetical protein